MLSRMVHAPDVIDAPGRARRTPTRTTVTTVRPAVPTDGTPTVRPARVLGRHRDRRGVLHLRLHPARTRSCSCATPPSTGGDTGAHVWFPDYLSDHLLPWRVAGWSHDFYAGFPAGQFYFPFPALLIVLLDVVLPYNIAFKLVTALGPVALPDRRVRVRPRHPRAASGGAAVRRRRHRLPVLQGRRRRDHDVRPPHHGRHAREHARGRVLVHDRGRAARSSSSARWRVRARPPRPDCGCPRCCSRSTLTSHLVVAIFAVLAGVVIWLLRRPVRNFTRVAAIGAVGVAAHRGLARAARGDARVHDRHALRAGIGTGPSTSTGCSCPRSGSCTCSP